MRILLDGMGGDNAPQEIVKGAVLAAELIEEEIVIIGREEAIRKELKRNKYKGTKITVVDAREEITMHDSPVKAIREKKDSSLVVGLNMLKEDLSGYGEYAALSSGGRRRQRRIKGTEPAGVRTDGQHLHGKGLGKSEPQGGTGEPGR